jgi:hypothetical protein
MLEFLAGVVFGASVSYLLVTWVIRQFITRALAEDVASDEDLVIRARVEEDKGVFYFYNNKSGEFLVQGSNLQELLEHLELRRPGTTVQVVDGDKETIAHLKSLAK